MIPAVVYHYRDPAAVMLGLQELRSKGVSLRGLLFVALDPRGETYIAVPDDIEDVAGIRVGDKFALKPPWVGRYYHFDSIHRLPGDTVLWNGDRRLNDTGSASEVATAIANWLRGSSAKNVFLGCTAHQPGCWWTQSERSPVIDLVELGLADTVVTPAGLLARRLGEPTLMCLPTARLLENGAGHMKNWERIYTSTLGNIILVERRALGDRLVLTCEDGLVELDLSGLPQRASETLRAKCPRGMGIVGRTDKGSYAITQGVPQPWGLDDVSPAKLVGDEATGLLDLPGIESMS